MSLSDSRPERSARELSHVPPAWVPTNATFFVTINCRKRGIPQLTIPEVASELFESINHYHQMRRWFPEIVLLMPDHLHALISFSWEEQQGMSSIIRSWKRYAAKQFGIEWQRDYFDHRIRSEADHESTWYYIRENPVRKGLVESYDRWPHVWLPDRIGWAVRREEGIGE